MKIVQILIKSTYSIK